MRNVAIVTGASSGIGKAFVREIVKEHGVYGSVPFQEVWVIARREDRLNQLKEDLDPARIVPIAVDLADEDAVNVIATKLQEEPETRVGLIVNCAGVGKRGMVEDKDIDVLDSTININCLSLSKLTKVCLPYMITKNPPYDRKDGPRVINIASTAAFLPQPGFAAYAASKAYVVSFSRALDFELMPYNISVTTVCPGPVSTEFQANATDGENSEFTGFRAHVVADPTKLAIKALKASKAGRHMLVYGFSQKCLHVASKIIPTYWILWIMDRLSNRDEAYILPPVAPTEPVVQVAVDETEVEDIPSGVQVTDIDEKIELPQLPLVESSSEVVEGDSEAARRILGL